MKKLMLLSFALFYLAPLQVYAACVPVGSVDGMMATVVCYPDPQPVQPMPTFSSPNFDFGVAALNLSPPVSTSRSGITFHTGTYAPEFANSSPSFDLSPRFVTLPQMELPNVPQAVPTRSFELPKYTEPIDPHASARAAAENTGAVVYMLYRLQQTALKAANQELDETKKMAEDWAKTNSEQLEVQINSEFAAASDAIAKATDAANSNLTGAVKSDGLLIPDLISDPAIRFLSEKLALKSDIKTAEGRLVRQLINRALALSEVQAGAQQIDTLKTSIVMSVGADLALSEGRNDDASRLLRGAGITLDIAMGFVPVASSLNDATQIVFGVMTGRDYNGNYMTASEYSLRSAGIVLGLLPASAGTMRFGALVINRASLLTAKWIRKLPITKIDDMTRAAGMILANPVGAVGEGVSSIIRYRRIFQDSERFNAMMSAIRPYNSFLTNSGRALTKHPEALGFESPEALRRALPRDGDLNREAQKLVERILLQGKTSMGYQRTLGVDVIEITLPNGIGARFHKGTQEFITFIRGKR